MADRIRQIAQRLKDKVHLKKVNITSQDKIDQFISKYAPDSKIAEIAEKFKHGAFSNRVQDLVTRYEKFTGVEEIMAIQNTVIEAQDKFMSAQEQRRDLGKQLASIEARLKELHAEMQNTSKGDEKYLHLCTEEHKLIVQERALRTLFAEAEKEERELFATMSAAVKLGHERERAHAERNKYWYIVASIFGTVLGIGGSTVNNRLKMAEFREMMEEQMAKSAGVLYSIAGGAGGAGADIGQAMKTEFAYQEHLAHSIKAIQENVNHLLAKQNALVEHMHTQEQSVTNQFRELKRTVVAASQTSAKSDAELAKALSIVHQDLDEDHKALDTNKNHGYESNQTQILTGLGILLCLLIFGNVLGRVS